MADFNGTKFRDVNQGGNHIVFSKCTQAELTIENSGYSIKAPIQGEENYTIDSKHYKIKHGEFLIVNKNQNLTCKVNSLIDVKGNCVYLDEKLVDNTFNDIINKNLFFDKANSNELNLYNGNYRIENNGLSSILIQLTKGNICDFNLEEWYVNFAFELLKHQFGVNQLMNKLNISKYSTKQELRSRLNTAKSYIIDNYKEDLTIEKISLNACVSKFHLIRTFKEVFGETPYNYLTRIRLDKASKLINQNKFSIEYIAIETGFKDRQNLSRNFKNQFGYSPSELIAV